jgi:hypothetical protein
MRQSRRIENDRQLRALETRKAGNFTKECPEVSLTLNGKEEDVAGHFVATLELDLRYRQMKIQPQVLQIRSDSVDGVVAGTEGRYVGKYGAHPDRALAIFHSQLGNR